MTGGMAFGSMPFRGNSDVPKVLNVHMNEIYKKLTTIK